MESLNFYVCHSRFGYISEQFWCQFTALSLTVNLDNIVSFVSAVLRIAWRLTK